MVAASHYWWLVSRQGGTLGLAVDKEETMKKSMLLLLVPAIAAVSAASRYLGGWAVVTVDELPDYATVRQPLKLSFIVRQHGMRPLDGLRPRVEARSGKVDMSVDALPVLGAGSGRYVPP